MNVIPTYLISIKLVLVIKRAPCWHVSLSWLYPRSGLILGLPPANERRRYKVTPSLIGWAQTYYQPWRLWYASHHWYHSWCVPEFARNVSVTSHHRGQGDVTTYAKPPTPSTNPTTPATTPTRSPQPKPAKPNLFKRANTYIRQSLRNIAARLTGIRPCSIEQDIIDNLRLNTHYGHRPDTYKKTYVKFH